MKSSRHIYGRLGGAHPSRIRALSPAAWYQPGVGVTGTLAASVWADQSGNTGRNLEQATAGNQPIYLSYSGTPYAYLPGVALNNCGTPDSAAASITSDIDIRVDLALDDYTPAAFVSLLAKWAAADANSAYCFGLNAAGTLSFVHVNGTTQTVVDSTAATGVTDAARTWLRVTWNKTTGATNFYKSADGSAWTQIGNADVAGPTAAMNDGNREVTLGATSGGAANFCTGKFYRAQIYSGIAGTLKVDFNPADFAETSTNAATAVSSGTGETWTLNSTGAKPAQIVKSSSLLGDGSASKMATANFTLDQPVTEYIVARQITWTAGDYLSSGTAGAAGITQVAGTPKIGLNAGSGVADNTGAVLGSKVIITAQFNGASSLLQVNAAAATTGDAGAGNPGGLSLFSDNAGANYGNWQVYERVVFSAAHTAAERAVVQNYLAARHGIAL